MRNPFPNREASELGKTIARLEERIRRLEEGSRQSQLAYSSIENGSIKAYGADGVLRQQIGRQNDGTFAVRYANGPKPPMPTDPLTSPAQLALVIYWDGEFRTGADAPGDFARCDVHICRDEDLVGGDFEVGPGTLYGSLLRESAVTIPLDNSTYWVKLVAVNTSDVASDPTPMVQGIPAAAHHIESKSIGAEQLKTNIVLASRIIAGDEEGQHWEMDPTGLRAYNNLGQQTIGQNSQTGDAFFVGSISSAERGQRMVFNDPDANPASLGSLAFYGPDGEEHASIHHDESFDATSVGVTIESSESDAVEDSYGSLSVQPTGITGGNFLASSGTPRSAFYAKPDFFSVTSPEIAFDLLAGNYPPNGTSSWKFRRWTWNGTAYQFDTTVEFVNSPTAPSSVGLRFTSADSMIVAAGGNMRLVSNADGSNYRIWYAADFFPSSDSATKTNIEAPDFSPLQVVLSNPSKSWKRKADPNDDHADHSRHFGPMADGMPEAFRRTDDNGLHALSMIDMIGLLWGAVQELAEDRGIRFDRSKLPKKEAKSEGDVKK